MTRSWISLSLLLLLLLGTTDGYLNGLIGRCVFNSTHLEDTQLIVSWFYNKLELIRFDSNVGLFVGYTEFGVKQAERWNKDTAYLERWRHEKDRVCVTNVAGDYTAILSKSVKPDPPLIHTASSSGSERVLVCSVYGFFPQNITVTWTNNHQQITSGVSNSPPMPDSDWYYQRHSQLEYTPRSGDQISCMVEHVSLKEPMVLDYEGALSDGDRNKVAIGASGLVLGLVLSLAGFIYYRHKSRGLILVPSH